MKLLRSVSIVLGALALTSCVTTNAVTDQLPEPAAFAEGQGMVIGSVVMVTPTGVTDPDNKEMLDALKQRKLTATIQRYVIRGFGEEKGWRKYVGDKYVASFDVDSEKRVVIRAPAGKYSVLELSASFPGLFGNETGCTMDNPAKFEIHAGRTTYIGRLVVNVRFKSERDLKWAKSFERSEGVWVLGMPERWLDMSLTATDTKQATLRNLVTDSSHALDGIETDLMKVGIGRWRAPTTTPPSEHPRVGTGR